MEADSTTIDSLSKLDQNQNDQHFPFSLCPGNLQLYKNFCDKQGGKNLELHVVERMQDFGLLPKTVPCPTDKPECNVVTRTARVVDRIQWICESCGKRQPIRTGTFFLRLQCSLLQALQVILAWCEDADCETTALHLGIKSKVAIQIYDRMDELVLKEQSKLRLGGLNKVVLAEMYPDCLTRLSPDTTDQPHVHRILMLADTNHIPTRYQLHVIKDDLKKNGASSLDGQSLKSEIEEAIANYTVPGSTLVTGTGIHVVEGASSVQDVIQLCDDVNMAHFLTSRIWRQAVSLCTASRDLCASGMNVVCADAVQRYLTAALYRLRFDDGFYGNVLRLLADEHTGFDSG